MAINSRQKGSGFELKVAKILSEWSGEKFHRTPLSGALHWSNDNRVISDIVPPQSLVNAGWPFSIECKNVETSWEFNTFIEGTSQTLKEHWQQCYDDAQREHMIPMLVVSKNYRGIYVILMTDTFLFLKVDIENIQLNCLGWKLTIMKLSELLEKISCEQLLKKNLLNTQQTRLLKS